MNFQNWGEQAIEGCNRVFIRFFSPDTTQAYSFDLEISGSATPGQDYSALPTSINLPRGKDSVWVIMEAFEDSLDGEEEEVIIEVHNKCPGLPPLKTLTIPIREGFEYYRPIEDTLSVCFGDSVELNPDYDPELVYSWAPADYLSCTECPNPVARPDSSIVYYTTVRHAPSDCQVITDSIQVGVGVVAPPLAAFGVEQPKGAYTLTSAKFTNRSQNADSYEWNFGDGGSSTAESPIHVYKVGYRLKDTVYYDVKLRAIHTDPFCYDEYQQRIALPPLYLPNVMTPNGDGKNDAFAPEGFVGPWILEVYNRWGQPIFQTEGPPIWQPEDQIPSGTYYYLLRSPDSGQKIKGFIEVIR